MSSGESGKREGTVGERVERSVRNAFAAFLMCARRGQKDRVPVVDAVLTTTFPAAKTEAVLQEEIQQCLGDRRVVCAAALPVVEVLTERPVEQDRVRIAVQVEEAVRGENGPCERDRVLAGLLREFLNDDALDLRIDALAGWGHRPPNDLRTFRAVTVGRLGVGKVRGEGVPRRIDRLFYTRGKCGRYGDSLLLHVETEHGVRAGGQVDFDAGQREVAFRDAQLFQPPACTRRSFR